LLREKKPGKPSRPSSKKRFHKDQEKNGTETRKKNGVRAAASRIRLQERKNREEAPPKPCAKPPNPSKGNSGREKGKTPAERKKSYSPSRGEKKTLRRTFCLPLGETLT